AESAIAGVVLDGLNGRGAPRIAIAGDGPVSPSRALVRTAAARVAEETRVTPAIASVPTQLLDLGLPFAAGEQGRFLRHHISAVTITTSDPGAAPPGSTAAGPHQRLREPGPATQALPAPLPPR